MPLRANCRPPDAMNPSSELDPGALDRLRRLGGEKFTNEMIRLFLGYGGEKLGEARKAQLAGDLAGVEKAVHPIKSSAGNVGAVRMQQLAAEAEQRAREQQADEVSTLMDQLEAAFQTVRPLLEAEKQTGASTDEGKD